MEEISENNRRIHNLEERISTLQVEHQKTCHKLDCKLSELGILTTKHGKLNHDFNIQGSEFSTVKT